METYEPKELEKKWQERWLNENIFRAADKSGQKKMYILDMFPYPSGDGLHVGHVKIYTASDVVSRYLRMKGFNVLHPTGWDAFGLPTENTAIKKKIHPTVLTEQNIIRFRQQMQSMGLSYDWSREINTTDPNYYKWTQWLFLQLFKMGLAYQDTIPINWCPSCKTGLSNEEVIQGKCERCGTEVEERPMKQWMLRITKYADQLLEGLGGLDWPAFVIDLQKNWIGRSEGTELEFGIEGSSEPLQVFTTRPDTLFGATYVVLAPNHPLVETLTTAENKAAVEAYREEANKPIRVNLEAQKDKTGVFTGSFAINPITNKQIPIWISDYVLMSYGSGAIMAVPAHDERDFAFATKYSLPIEQVIVPETATDEVQLPYLGEGILINSEHFSGQKSEDAKKSIPQALQIKGKSKKKVQYKLRDWVFSRQRYWGEPIPIIHCEHCGTVAVPEKDLPVTLPPVESYEPTGTGESPLASVKEWVEVKCPRCPRMAKRETNTMPQWAGSSWYWLRFTSPHNQEAFADKEALAKWLPVDVYIGGSEHAVLHLLYARFWQRALHDAGLVTHNEPFQRFRAVGLVIGEDGQKMSKSRGNVINPDDVVKEWGADALRVYEMFMGPFEGSAAWNTNGLKGSRRFIERVWDVVIKHVERVQKEGSETIPHPDIDLLLHQTIRKVSESTEQFKFNTAISAMMEFLNSIEKKTELSNAVVESLVKMLAPYAPHVAEELWEKLGHSQSLTYEKWPDFDQRVLETAQVKVVVQVNGRVRGELTIAAGTSQEDVEAQAKAIENVAKHLAEGTIVKTIFVPDRILNYVVSK